MRSVFVSTFVSSVAASLVVIFASPAFAAMKTYQVTGPVLALTDAVITVQKGQEKWEIARDPAAKVTGELKVGQKVTIQYRMVAEEIEVKGDASAPKADKAAAKKKK